MNSVHASYTSIQGLQWMSPVTSQKQVDGTHYSKSKSVYSKPPQRDIHCKTCPYPNQFVVWLFKTSPSNGSNPFSSTACYQHHLPNPLLKQWDKHPININPRNLSCRSRRNFHQSLQVRKYSQIYISTKKMTQILVPYSISHWHGKSAIGKMEFHCDVTRGYDWLIFAGTRQTTKYPPQHAKIYFCCPWFPGGMCDSQLEDILEKKHEQNLIWKKNRFNSKPIMEKPSSYISINFILQYEFMLVVEQCAQSTDRVVSGFQLKNPRPPISLSTVPNQSSSWPERFAFWDLGRTASISSTLPWSRNTTPWKGANRG